jgi:Zn-dependent peptidase ImmA (M78 family)
MMGHGEASRETEESMRPDYRRALAEAQRILRETQTLGPPVDPIEIALSYGIKVNECDFEEFSKDVAGFFDFEERAVYVNDQEPFVRKTFTIAHEIGHYFLHSHHFEKNPDEYAVLLRRPMGATKDPLEQEANAFAANLLVPRKFLDQYYRIASVEELANLFMVSKDVIRNRIQFEYKITS